MNVSHTLLFLIAIHTFSEAVAISGFWGEWGDWSECSVTCGFGTTKRNRNWEYEDGSILNFTYTVVDGCWTKKPCPIHGKWGMWTAWSKCPVMCGGGTKARTRQCNSPEPSKEGGLPCKDEGYEKVVCNVEDCPELPPNFDISLCNETTYMCDNLLQCVDIDQQCDGKLHCHDGSDEKGCFKFLFMNNQGSWILSSRSPFLYTAFLVSLLMTYS